MDQSNDGYYNTYNFIANYIEKWKIIMHICFVQIREGMHFVNPKTVYIYIYIHGTCSPNETIHKK